MFQDPLTLYKLIVLYMLNKVSFPLSSSQIGDFILEKDYTNFLTLQQVFSDLKENNLIASKTVRNRTLFSITEEGMSTLSYFQNRISDAIKKDIIEYLRQNEMELRNEVSVLADYYKSTGGEYEAHLWAKDRDSELVSIKLTVPTEEIAASICTKWQDKSQQIYQYLTAQLF
ncbi:MAG: DUF4364 family protein [Lachnospiraceae bacterium]|nr:DUF4364 family protein [Lachnospiraceae bacterium]